jgi:transposase
MVEYNKKNIKMYREKYSGCYCLMTTNIPDKHEARQMYKNRDVVEKTFDEIKNEINSRRLRVHSKANLDSLVFIIFITLIFYSKIKKTLIENRNILKIGVLELFKILRPLKITKYKNKYPALYSETSPLQRRVLGIFKVKWPPLEKE